MDLDREQKIAVLEETLVVLGPDGENWARGYWFGKKGKDHVPGLVAPNMAEPYDQADCWCLEGALCESAVRLGVLPKRDTAAGSTLGQDISLTEQLGRPLFGYNDDPKTTWADIRRELIHRIEKLKAERPYEAQTRFR